MNTTGRFMVSKGERDEHDEAARENSLINSCIKKQHLAEINNCV